MEKWKNRSFDEKADGKGVAFGVDDRDGVLSLGSDDVHLVDIFGGAEVFGIKMPEHFGLGIAVSEVESRSLDAAVKLPGYGDGAAVFRIYESHRNGGIPVCGLSRPVWRKSLVFGMVLPVIPLHRRREDEHIDGPCTRYGCGYTVTSISADGDGLVVWAYRAAERSFGKCKGIPDIAVLSGKMSGLPADFGR